MDEIKEIDKVVAHLVKELGQAKSHIKELEEGIREVLDGTLPYLAEQRLRKLVKKESK